MAESRWNDRIKTLTKAQLEEPEALDLLQLLQGFTDDGRLLDEEVHALREWLESNQDSDLPGVVYLREVVEEVLKDGKISVEERRFLQQAVERVMPKEERDVAILRRREAEQLARPVVNFDIMAAGVSYVPRPDLVRKMCRTGDRVFLVREPQNEYSRSAIRLRMANGFEIGYVPDHEAQRLAPLLDKGALQSAEIKKVLHGRRVPTPVVWGELYDPEAPVEEALPMDAAPAKMVPSGSPRRSTPGAAARPAELPSYFWWLVAIALLIVLVWIG